MSRPAPLERAIAALRAGRAVRVAGLAVLSVETGTAAMLDLLDPDGRADLILSGARAVALGLGNEAATGDGGTPVRIARTAWLDRESALAIVDPGQDLSRGPTGPLAPVAAPDGAGAALALARLAGLLPALWLVEGDHDVVAVAAADIAAAPVVTIASRAALPVEGLPASQLVVMRENGSGEEHAALLVGAFGGRPPLTRLHSECLTGDVFGSLKCDCGPQLREALRLIAADGGGVLLYLRQEGRGIGLANKLRAYALQDRGLDTVDSNRRLGFADDHRDYRVAAAMLRALGVDSVRLLTNNPAKVAGLEAAGVAVVERVAHAMPANPHNADYLATKRSRSGHLA